MLSLPPPLLRLLMLPGDVSTSVISVDAHISLTDYPWPPHQSHSRSSLFFAYLSAFMLSRPVLTCCAIRASGLLWTVVLLYYWSWILGARVCLVVLE